MNDQDALFELCKQVYEKTGWKPTDRQHGDENGQPLYTSDYLLEKLPPSMNSIDDGDNWLKLWVDGNVGEKNKPYLWWAEYTKGDDNYTQQFPSGVDNTPTKALLKLTIALSEAGEL